MTTGATSCWRAVLFCTSVGLSAAPLRRSRKLRYPASATPSGRRQEPLRDAATVCAGSTVGSLRSPRPPSFVPSLCARWRSLRPLIRASGVAGGHPGEEPSGVAPGAHGQSWGGTR